MRLRFLSRYIVIILLLLAGFSSYSQNITVSGKVTDTLKNSLPYANILAIPVSDDQDVKFSISENDGGYKLRLVKNQGYELTVSYLGYKPQTLRIATSNNQ